MAADIHRLLKQYYGYDAFRPLQEDIIQSVLQGNDTLALLPTGGGKSVCYQIPAMAQEGICLVITPLIALMKDQVSQLRRRNVSALAIYSGMSFFEVKKALENAASGHFKFLYLSPERLQTKLFQEYLPAMPVNLIAVDEAHCISQWGYDFRPPYLKIADLREELSDVPILALTASATQDVQDDICDKLAFVRKKTFRQSFERANLSFSVFNTPHKMGKLTEILTNVGGTALVYVRNRRRTKEIAHLLSKQGINATYYHAGLTNEERSQRQEAWIGNKVRVMVCTNAFGMGIDKPDVRVVVHMDVPDCLENYYQEAGRGGRDGKKSYAVLLYTADEIQALEELPDKKFPPIEAVRQVYQTVCDYMQVPVGNGQGQYFDFNVGLCAERFKTEPSLLVTCLQTLAQAGYLSFSETVFIGSKVGFTINKQNLYEFEENFPKLEPTIKALLRSYEGIFDNIVSISERVIARVIQAKEEDVIVYLKQLMRYGIIQYQPKKDTPQIFFLYDRIPASQVTIDAQLYERRKQQYKLKVAEMIRYTANNKTCRSNIIRQYFGDEKPQPCGICDVCLSKKNQSFTREQLLQTAGKILLLLPQYNSTDKLQAQLKTSKALTEAALQYLVREEKIQWNSEGHFHKTDQ